MTYDRQGQRIRDQITGWYLLGLIPLYVRREEVWRKAMPITDALRQRVFEADAWQCVYCGSSDRTTLTVDHRTPQVMGGISTFESLLTACKNCNGVKNGRTPEEAAMPLCYGRFRHLTNYPEAATRQPDQIAIAHADVVLLAEDETEVTEPFDPMDLAVDAALRRGDELTDDQIKYVHLQRRWSPTRIAESRGVRGRKQVRLERVYAALGLRRELTEVEQPA
jgi:hypothetical protein